MSDKKGQSVKITRAGYLYINGVRHPEKLTPVNHPVVDDPAVAECIRIWLRKNWTMC